MKVLVTGSTGTIGPNVIRRLVIEGHEVYALVRPQSASVSRIARYLEAGTVHGCYSEIRDNKILREVVAQVEAIIHLAAAVPLGGTTNQDYVDSNVKATSCLLELVRCHNPSLKRFVYASTTALYPQIGFREQPFTDTDRTTRPTTLYSITKLTGELLTHAYQVNFGLPTVTLVVPETFCGRELLGERLRSVSPFIEDHIEALQTLPPGKKQRDCLEALHRRYAQGKRLIVPLTPKGEPWRRHMGDVRDIALAFLLALDAPRVVGESLPIMSDAMDYGVGVPHLAKLSGLEYVEEIIPIGDSYWFDMGKTHELLGYRAQFDSKTMMSDAWRHLHGHDIGIVDGACYPRLDRQVTSSGSGAP